MRSKILSVAIGCLIVVSSFGCNKVIERVGDKINEKTNEAVEENLRRVDSALKVTQQAIDSMKNVEQMDTVKSQLDSVSKELDVLIKQQQQKINELKNK